MNFIHNYLGQRDIINNILILTKRGSDTIYNIITEKCHKYPSTTILKLINFLDKVNKLPYKCLLNMMPREAYSIKTYVRTTNLAYIRVKTYLPPTVEQPADSKSSMPPVSLASVINQCRNITHQPFSLSKTYCPNMHA